MAAAESHFTAAMAVFDAFGDWIRLANAMQGLAAIEALTGRPESAARHLGEAVTVLRETGWSADGSDLLPAATAAARDALGDEAFDRLFEEGTGPAAG